jgi:hypothetical protein
MALPLPLAVELALERAVAYAELRGAGSAGLWPTVVAAARGSTIVAVAPTHTRYLRALTFGRLRMNTPNASDTGDQPLDVAVRLFPRVLEVAPEEALTTAALAEALVLEIAAVGSGRLMIEWVLLRALGQPSADPALGDGLERQSLA